MNAEVELVRVLQADPASKPRVCFIRDSLGALGMRAGRHITEDWGKVMGGSSTFLEAHSLWRLI